MSGTTYTCTGNGRVTLGNNDVLTANTNITIFAANGIRLNNNTVGTAANNIQLQSDYGDIEANGSNSVFGNLQTVSGDIDLNNTDIIGSITTTGGGADIVLDGGSVAGAISAGGSVSLEDVTMTNGSIFGAAGVSLEDSAIGSSSSPINISTSYAAINVEDSTVYGDLTAPSYSVVNVDSSTVIGECLPRSNPANACSPAPPVCPAGGAYVSGIIGQYFDNISLSGEPDNTRVDGPINFDWGNGASGVAGISADRFSVRWEGSLRVTQSGNYRFQTVSDDGVRLWVNGVQVINNWSDHAATTNTSGNVNLTAGEIYSIRMEFYENGGQAVARLRWLLPGAGSYVPIPAGPTPTLGAGLYHCSAPAELCATGTPTGGISGQYFNNLSLSGTPAGSRVDGPINFDWGTGAPGVSGVNANQFSVRWEGILRPTVSGNYQFQTVSDDGVRLTVNNQLLIDNWGDHSATTDTSNNIYLAAGELYAITLEFYENNVDAEIRLRWRVPSTASFVPVPAGPSPTLGAGLYYCASAPVVASYLLSHASSGVTCEAEPIIVTALDAANNPIAPPAGTVVALATVPGTGVWVDGNSYAFGGAETSFTKFLQQTTPAELTINVADGVASGTSVISFADTGLRFYDLPALPNSMVAGLDYSGATLRVVETNTDTGACEARVTGSRSVGLAYECLDPAVCSLGQNFTVNGGSIAANDGGSVSNYGNVTLNFDAAGTASIPLNFSDVGRVRLHGRLELPPQDEDPAITFIGDSADFIVRPHSFVLTSVRNTSNVVNNGSSGFAAAGEDFTIVAQARNAGGGVTPNFGNEASPEGIELRLNGLVYPAVGTEGALANSTSFGAGGNPGEFENTVVSWNEVGTVNINAHVDGGNYMGAGDVVEAPDVAVGRFYPHHFEMSAANVEDSCSGFTYMSHPAMRVVYQLVARSVTNGITTNYTSPGYAETASINYVAENLDNGTDLGTRVTVENAAWVNGTWLIDTQTAAFERKPHETQGLPALELDGPFDNLQLGLFLTDPYTRPLEGLNMDPGNTGDCLLSDNCTAITLGSPRVVRFGRLRLDDAFGPESVNLPVNFVTEFWSGSFFTTSNTDSCTEIPRNAINYVQTGPIVLDANRTVPLSGGSTQGVYANLQTDNVVFTDGNAGHFFSAPGAGTGTFNVDINLASLPWLRSDWNQDGDFTDLTLPRANFGFGQYRGHDRIIYWREVFE